MKTKEISIAAQMVEHYENSLGVASNEDSEIMDVFYGEGKARFRFSKQDNPKLFNSIQKAVKKELETKLEKARAELQTLINESAT